MVGRQADQLTLKRKSTDNWVRSHPGEGRYQQEEDEGEEVQEEEKGLNIRRMKGRRCRKRKKVSTGVK